MSWLLFRDCFLVAVTLLLRSSIVEAQIESCRNSWCWETPNDFEYKLITTPYTFTAAQVACAAEGGTLALPYQAAFSVLQLTGEAAAWSDITLSGRGTSYTQNSSGLPFTNISIWVPQPTDTLKGDCGRIVNTSSGFEFVSCSTTNFALCQRKGTPQSWFTVNGSYLEYGYFSRLANFTTASAECARYGANLAYIPQSYARTAIWANLNSTNATGWMWTGWFYSGGGQWVTYYSLKILVSYDPPGAGTGCASALPDATTYQPDNCTSERSFLCTRFAVALSTPYCLNDTSQTMYSYLPAVNASIIQNVTDLYTAYNVTESKPICNWMGGNISRFARPSEIVGCFGRAATEGMTTPFEATPSSGYWFDGSTAPISTVFANAITTLPFSRSCYWLNSSSTTASGEAVGSQGTCHLRMPTVCEVPYSGDITVYFNVSNATLQEGYVMSTSCKLRLWSFLSRPPAPGQQVQVCPTGIPSSWTIACMTFGPGNTSAFTDFTFTDTDSNRVDTIKFAVSCTPSSICAKQAALGPIPRYVLKNGPNEVKVKISSLDQDPNSFPISINGRIGTPYTAAAIGIYPIGTDSSIWAPQNVTVQLTQKTDADECTITPSYLLIRPGQTVPLTIFCVGGSDLTAFTVTMWSSAGGSVPGKRESCAVRDISSLAVLRFTMSLPMTISIPSSVDFYPYGQDSLLNITLSSPPVAVNNVLTWLCIRPIQFSAAGITSDWGCWFSRLNTTTITMRMRTTNYATLQSSMSMTVTAIGPARRQYNMSDTVQIQLRLVRYNASLTGLRPVEYQNNAIALLVRIPFPVPGGETLTTEIVWNFPSACGGLSNQLIQFGAGFVTGTASAYTGVPTCVANGTLGLNLDGSLKNLFTPFIENSIVIIATPTTMIIVNPPRWIYFNAPPQPIQVTTGTAPQGGDLTILQGTVPGFLVAPIQWTPSQLSWNASSPLMQTFWVRATAVVLNFSLAWSTAASVSKQYLAPSPIVLGVQNQSQITFSLQTVGVTFVNGTYSVFVTVQNLPLTQGHTVQAIVDPSVSSMVWNQSAWFNSSSTSFTSALRFQLTSLPNTSYFDLPIILSDFGAAGYFPNKTTIRVPNIRAPLTVSAEGPAFLLFSSDSSNPLASKDLTFRLSAPPTVSSNITVFIIPSSSSLSISGSVAWIMGSSAPVTVRVTSTRVDALANLTFRARAYASNGQDTQEVGLVFPSNLVIPIRSRTTVTINPVSLSIRQERSAVITIALQELPSPGSYVTITLTGPATGFVSFDPPNATFSATTPYLIANITVTALSETPLTSVEYQVSGTASLQYATNIIRGFISISRRLEIIPTFPLALIAGQGNMSADLTLEQLPEAGTTLNVTLNCSSCRPTDMSITPSTLTWNVNSSITQTVYLQAYAPLPYPGVIQLILSGDARGFAPRTISLELRNPSPVVIRFPQGRWYAGEQPEVVVNITNPLLNNASQLMFTSSARVTPDCGSIFDFTFGRDVPICTVSPTLIEFSGMASAMSFLINSSSTSLANVTFNITLAPSGNALPQYNFSSTGLAGSVVFRPKRKIAVVNMPPRFYAGYSTPLSIQIEENPDPGQQLLVETRNIPGVSLTSLPAVWTGNVNNTFDSPEVRSINVSLRMGVTQFALAISETTSRQQRIRYTVAAPVNVTVMEKVSLSFGSVPLLRNQVLGKLNNQTFTVTLSRAPLQTLVATPRYTSAVPLLLSFTPPQIIWYPNATSSNLTVQVSVTGNSPGPATDLRIELAGLGEELVSDTFFVQPGRDLTITNRHVVYFNVSSDPMYVGDNNARLLNISVSSLGSKQLALKVAYGMPNAMQILPSMVYFNPTDSALWQTVRLVGLQETVLSADVNVTIVSGTEFEKVVRLSSTTNNKTQTAFTIFGLLQATLDNGQGSVIQPYGNITIKSDMIYNWQIQLEGTMDGRNVTYQLHTQSYLVKLIPKSFTFYSGGPLFYDIMVVASTLTPFNAIVNVTPPDGISIAKKWYTFTLTVVPDVEVNVSGFPTIMVVGPANKKSFWVQPHAPPDPGDSTFLVAETINCPSSVAVIDGNGPALRWIEGNDAKQVSIIGVSPGTCTIQVRKNDYNPITNFWAVFFTATVQIVPEPGVLWIGQTNKSKKLVFRDARNLQTTYAIGAISGVFNASLTYTVRNPSLSEALQAVAEDGYAVVLSTNRLISDEPLGFQQMMENGRNRETIQFTVSADRSRATLLFGPMSDLLLLGPETITLTFTRYAFVGSVAPSLVNRSLNVTVSEYVANIVTPTDENVAQYSMLASVIVGLYFAPPLALQGAKTFYLLTAFDCPRQNWIDKQDNIGLMLTAIPVNLSFGPKEYLGRWLTVAVINVAFCILIGFFHFLVTLGFYLQRRKGSDRKLTDIFGRIRFPSLSFLPVFALVQPTVEACFRVIIYSPDVGYRVAAFIVATAPIFFFTAGFHGVVWRNTSLVWRSNDLSKSSILGRIFRQSGEWVHPTNASYMKRYGILFQNQRVNYRWYFLFEYSAAILLGIINAIEPSIIRGCVAKTASLTVVLLIQFIVICLWTPFRVFFTNVAFGVIYLLQVVAMVIMTEETGNRIRNDFLQLTAMRLIQVSSGLWILCALILALAAIVDLLFKQYGLNEDEEETAAKESKDKRSLLQFEDRLIEQPGGGQQRDKDEAEKEGQSGRSRQATIRIEDSDDEDEAQVAVLDAWERENSRQPLGVFRSGKRSDIAFSPLRKKELERQRQRLAEEQTRAPQSDGNVEILPPESVMWGVDGTKDTVDPLRRMGWLNQEAMQQKEEEERRKKQLELEASQKPKLRLEEAEIPVYDDSDDEEFDRFANL